MIERTSVYRKALQAIAKAWLISNTLKRSIRIIECSVATNQFYITITVRHLVSMLQDENLHFILVIIPHRASM